MFSNVLAILADPLGDAQPYPLALPADTAAGNVDLAIDGTLGTAAAGERFTYGVDLSARLSYDFLVSEPAGGNAVSALLADAVTGEVFWGNGRALDALGLDPSFSLIPVRLAEDRSLALIVEDAAATGTEVDFRVEVDSFQPAYSDNAIYRFVKLSSGMYFYTANEQEKAFIEAEMPDFRSEGPVFIGDDEARPGYEPVHRFADLDNGGYFYTASEAERDIALGDASLRYEGVSFYVPAAPTADTSPVWRLHNRDTDGYLFTSNPAEKLFALLQGHWDDQGVAFHSAPPAAPEAEPTPESTDGAELGLVGVVDDGAVV